MADVVLSQVAKDPQLMFCGIAIAHSRKSWIGVW